MLKQKILKTRKGIPVVSKTDINNICEKLIGNFMPSALTSPRPVDIEYFIEQYLGWNLNYKYLSHCGVYLGMAVFNDTSKLPIYDPVNNCARYTSVRAKSVLIDTSLLADGEAARYNFTCAHESGHCFLHSDFYEYEINLLNEKNIDTPIMHCSVEPRFKIGKTHDKLSIKDRLEWQANYFASAMLMPKTMVKQLISEMPIWGTPVRRRAAHIAKMKTTFEVSTEAALYRLKDLGLYPSNCLDIEVC